MPDAASKFWTKIEYKGAGTAAGVEAKYRSLWGVWGDWNDTVENAWLLYRALVPGSGLWLDVQLLGDTKIRMDPALLASFGATGATGLQGDVEIRAVSQAAAERHKQSGQQQAMDAHVAETGSGGAILSEKTWSTLSNDSFMLAGIHQHKDFHFVGEFPEDAKDPSKGEVRFASFSRTKSLSRVAFLKEVYDLWSTGVSGSMAEAEAAVNAKQDWLSFFRKYPQIVWAPDSPVPRVFARELLGLKRFGYKPHFHELGLFFTCDDKAAASGATFDQYQTFLAHADSGPFNHGLGAGGAYTALNRTRILGVIHEYLFGRGVAV